MVFVPLCFDNYVSSWLIGHFEVICCKVCNVYITKIIFTMVFVHFLLISCIIHGILFLYSENFPLFLTNISF